MSEQSAVVAVYSTHAAAEKAVKELQRAGVDMRTLSIVGKDTQADEQAADSHNPGDRVKVWGTTGAFCGGLWGLTVVGDMSAIGAGPRDMGIPENSVIEYEMAVAMDKFLLMVHGTLPEVERARDIIQSTRPVNVTMHSAGAAGAGAR